MAAESTFFVLGVALVVSLTMATVEPGRNLFKVTYFVARDILIVTQKGMRCIQLVNGLRYFGVGAKVKRNIYKFPETYWIITR